MLKISSNKKIYCKVSGTLSEQFFAYAISRSIADISASKLVLWFEDASDGRPEIFQFPIRYDHLISGGLLGWCIEKCLYFFSLMNCTSVGLLFRPKANTKLQRIIGKPWRILIMSGRWSNPHLFHFNRMQLQEDFGLQFQKNSESESLLAVVGDDNIDLSRLNFSEIEFLTGQLQKIKKHSKNMSIEYFATKEVPFLTALISQGFAIKFQPLHKFNGRELLLTLTKYSRFISFQKSLCWWAAYLSNDYDKYFLAISTNGISEENYSEELVMRVATVNG